MHFKMQSAICFSLDQSKIFLSDNWLTLSLVLRVCSLSLLKTLWEKDEKFLLFPQSFLSAIVNKFEIVVCKLFEFARA